MQTGSWITGQSSLGRVPATPPKVQKAKTGADCGRSGVRSSKEPEAAQVMEHEETYLCVSWGNWWMELLGPRPSCLRKHSSPAKILLIAKAFPGKRWSCQLHTTSTKSTEVLQSKPFQIWTPLLHWDPLHGPAPNLLCGQENVFHYKAAVLPLNLLPKSEGFLALAWDFTDPMQCGMVLEKKCGCAAETVVAERRRSSWSNGWCLHQWKGKHWN